MRSLPSIVLILVSGLLACRHGDPFAGDGFGPAWAPERAVYIVVRIVPLTSEDELELLSDGEVIEMEAEVITAGDAPAAPDLHRAVGHNGSYSIYRAERGLK